MKKGVDFIGLCACFYCHDGNGNYVFHKRSANCRDEQGMWDCGGGSVQFGETVEQALIREIKEEYGADALKIELLGSYDALRDNDGVPTHWHVCKYKVLVDRHQVKLNEPDKQDEIGWFKIDDLPSPLLSQIPREIEMFKGKL